MPIYDYRGTDSVGKAVKGAVESDSAKSARTKLKKNGVILLSIDERKLGGGRKEVARKFLGRRSVPSKDLAVCTRQIASLIKANIPLVESLTAVMEQSELPVLKSVLADVRQRVNEGSSLSKALAAHTDIFTPIFINMIDAGEASGTLPLVLVRLADFMEAQERLKGKILSAMTYPLLMVLIGGGLMLGLFTFVIPRIAKIFDSMNRELPWYTQVVLDLSNFLVNYWYLVIFTALMVPFLIRTYIATEAGRAQKDKIILQAPIFGELIRLIAISRFANTMSTLLNGGVPIISALNIAKAIVDNKVLANAIEDAQENISEGQSIAGPLKRSGQFPPLIIHMIAIGEKTGELPQMLQMVAVTYEEQVSMRIERMTALLEPLMIVFMGLAVGIIVMAVFSPILQLQQSVS